MRATAYIDQNILSLLDNENVAYVFSEMNRLGLDTVVSHHHLTEICLSPLPLAFVGRLQRLRPYFLSVNQSEEIARAGDVHLKPIDGYAEIIWHRDNVRDLEQTFLRALFPLLRFTGGLATIDRTALAEDYVRSMRHSVNATTKELGPVLRLVIRPYLAFKLQAAERQIRRNFSSVDFDAEAKKFAQIRQKVASLGNISQIPANEVVAAVTSRLDQTERIEFTKDFPPNFARDPANRSMKIASFAFTLFALGAVSRSGKVFRGDALDQKKRFRAQFLDCLHIGEASYFEAFLTSDSGAHRLASVVYNYAGVTTDVRRLIYSQDA